MTIHSLKTRKALVVGLTFLTVLCVIAVAGAKRRQGPDSLPEVVSKVKHLEVRNVVVIGAGDVGAAVAVEIYNNSDKSIISLAMESGRKGSASGVSTDGFMTESGVPSVILQPYGIITMRMPLNDVPPGEPIRVAAVMYVDGTSEGDQSTKNTIEGFKQKAEKRRQNNQ